MTGIFFKKMTGSSEKPQQAFKSSKSTEKEAATKE